MSDVFLSYKREDRPSCVAINDALVALGLSVWFDARLELGVRFDKEIEREIHEAAAVLVLWSPMSADSDWVREEALVGRDRNCLVSARIAPCHLPMGFKAVQTADIFDSALDGGNEAWLQMLERIGGIVGRPGLAEFVRCKHLADAESWQAWLIRHRDDPLMPQAVALLAESASPDLRKRLAEERARRVMLEGEVEEYRATHEGQTSLLKESGAALAKLRRDKELPAAAEAAAAHALAGQAAAPARDPAGGSPPPAPPNERKRWGPAIYVAIGASLVLLAVALAVLLSRGRDRPAQDDFAAGGAGPDAPAAGSSPAQSLRGAYPTPRTDYASPAAPAPAEEPPDTGLSAESERPARPGPPANDIFSDSRGNVYSVVGGGPGDAPSVRMIEVRGDHRADQAILHRYSTTRWQFDCATRSYALVSRTNHHADGSIDRRPYDIPPVPESVIGRLYRAACR